MIRKLSIVIVFMMIIIIGQQSIDLTSINVGKALSIQLEKENISASTAMADDASTTTNRLLNLGILGTDNFGGAGTQENPYIISKASDLDILSAEVAAGNNFSG